MPNEPAIEQRQDEPTPRVEAIQSRVCREALSLAKCGLRVVPVPARSKGCKMPNWQMRASKNACVIRPWFPPNCRRNLGLATGQGIIALDLDSREVLRDRGDGRSNDVDGRVTLRALEFEAGATLPTTAEAITGGGGRHLLFRVDPSYVIGNRTGWRPGIDIKGDRGMIVVEPSIHPDTGREYVWTRHPKDGIAEAPTWLLELLITDGLLTRLKERSEDAAGPVNPEPVALAINPRSSPKSPNEAALVAEMIQKFPIQRQGRNGQRNDQMAKAVTSVLGRDHDPEVARRVVGAYLKHFHAAGTIEASWEECLIFLDRTIKSVTKAILRGAVPLAASEDSHRAACLAIRLNPSQEKALKEKKVYVSACMRAPPARPGPGETEGRIGKKSPVIKPHLCDRLISVLLCQNDPEFRFLESLMVLTIHERGVWSNGFVTFTDRQICELIGARYGCKPLLPKLCEDQKRKYVSRPGRPATRLELLVLESKGSKGKRGSAGVPSAYRPTGILELLDPPLPVAESEDRKAG